MSPIDRPLTKQLAVSVLTWLLSISTALALESGTRAPAIGLPDLNGDAAVIARGKVVLVDIWASWCEPCKKELPALDRLFRRQRSRGFRIIAVNIDKELSTVTEFLKEHPVAFTVVHDPAGNVPARYVPSKMPSSFLIDGKGIVRHVYDGYRSGDEVKLARDVDALLKELPAARSKATDGTASSAIDSAPTTATSEPSQAQAAESSTPSAAEPATDSSASSAEDGRPPAVAPSAAQRSGGLCSAVPAASASGVWTWVIAILSLAWVVRRVATVSCDAVAQRAAF